MFLILISLIALGNLISKTGFSYKSDISSLLFSLILKFTLSFATVVDNSVCAISKLAFEELCLIITSLSTSPKLSTAPSVYVARHSEIFTNFSNFFTISREYYNFLIDFVFIIEIFPSFNGFDVLIFIFPIASSY